MKVVHFKISLVTLELEVMREIVILGLLVLASLDVLVDCKVDIFHISEKLESFRFPTLPPWFPTGLPTGFPTGLPTGLPTIFPTSSVPEKEDKDKEQEIDDDKDDVIPEIQDPESESDNGKCPENGVKVMQHNSECGKYILCFGGVRIVRDCAPGLHWSSKLQSCTRPEFSECKEEIQRDCPKTNDSDNLVFIPDFKDCSK